MSKSSSRRSREQLLLFESSKKPFIVIECKILTTHKKKERKVPIGW